MIKASVIGCGSIGALKPDQYDRPGGENILTHAHAYHDRDDVTLTSVTDADEAKASKASRKWGCPSVEDDRADVVSVCVPTEQHMPVLIGLLEREVLPKIVVCEKPFCSSLEEATVVAREYVEAKVPLLINYSRRFSSAYRGLKSMIDRGVLGKIYHARLIYGRGLLRDGCHALDLFNWMFGDCLGLSAEQIVYDFEPDDPTTSVRMSYSGCLNVSLVGVDSRAYSIFEMDVVAEKARVTLGDNGATWHWFYPRTEEVYGSYKSMPGSPQRTVRSDLTVMLREMVSDAVDYASGRTTIDELYRVGCGPADALRVHTLIESINRSTRTNIALDKRKEGMMRCLQN